MKNISEVLAQKERQLEQLQAEIQALRLAERLLRDDGEAVEVTRTPVAAALSGKESPRQFP